MFSLEKTAGGNGNGAVCMYPFMFRGVLYHASVALEHGKWCATTSNYDRDKKWGYAIRKG